MPVANPNNKSIAADPPPQHHWQKHKPASKPRIDWELPRKLYHSIHGVVMILLYTRLPNWQGTDFLPLLIPPFLLYFYLDHRRLMDPNVNSKFVRVASRTMRPAERLAIRLTSSTAYMAGILVSLSVFGKRVAVLACLYLAFVDTAAAFGGRAGSLWLGPNWNRKVGWCVVTSPWGVVRSEKSIGGFVAAFVTAAIIYAVMIENANVAKMAISGIIGGLSEAVTIDGIDDDLSLPLLAGVMLTVLRSFLGL